MGFLSREQIDEMGFSYIGDNVLLSNKASFYNCANIVIGNNVRIDDFCVLSAGVGGIEIGNYIHIAVNTSLIGAGKIKLNDFSNISSKVAIYSSNDDYSGASMTSPMVSKKFTCVHDEDVTIGRHVIIGACSVVLPGVTLEEGVAIGALSMVSKSCRAFGIYSGVPAKRIKERKKDFLELEKQFLKKKNQ
ncbi:acyltransferase [Pseudomonas sp. TMW22090]|uniref:acyltransferase n=1 Tax=Pseudomonas sp. TMW22090 TaxID=2506434 RepID=UPI001F110665|nr:acyltransferase [Pseudomonas sp. TMW22090]MCH4880463.1 acyltransferase [Pseudomonas sp. TMW22090]